jgi:antitoxin (DNA-binding transcriptional repressor) of toxin-antitoxin stability system
MEPVTTHKAKTELSKLLKRVEAGEEIDIARGNKTIARLVPPTRPVTLKPRQPGSMRHLLAKIPDTAFFEPLPEDELKLWEGGD